MAAQSDNDNLQKALLSTLVLSYQGGLDRALQELAHFHGGKPGPWLDEIEAEVMRGIKTVVVEGLDITIEANALNAALATASMFFTEFRAGLESQAAGD
jgi:hypothetical protein